MTSAPARRKVLIIEDQPSIRNLLYVMLAGLGCDGAVASSARQALTMIGRENFDAVLLDLRCASQPAEEVVSQIKGIRPSLVGRVLVITGEVGDAQTMEVIERQCLPHLPQNRVVKDLWELLRPILGMPKPAS